MGKKCVHKVYEKEENGAQKGWMNVKEIEPT